MKMYRFILKIERKCENVIAEKKVTLDNPLSSNIFNLNNFFWNGLEENRNTIKWEMYE